MGGLGRGLWCRRDFVSLSLCDKSFRHAFGNVFGSVFAHDPLVLNKFVHRYTPISAVMAASVAATRSSSVGSGVTGSGAAPPSTH